jgi:hypothetical protein
VFSKINLYFFYRFFDYTIDLSNQLICSLFQFNIDLFEVCFFLPS